MILLANTVQICWISAPEIPTFSHRFLCHFPVMRYDIVQTLGNPRLKSDSIVMGTSKFFNKVLQKLNSFTGETRIHGLNTITSGV